MPAIGIVVVVTLTKYETLAPVESVTAIVVWPTPTAWTVIVEPATDVVTTFASTGVAVIVPWLPPTSTESVWPIAVNASSALAPTLLPGYVCGLMLKTVNGTSAWPPKASMKRIVP